MTCNQLMILLDAYRGTLERSRHLGGYDKDLALLIESRMLTPVGRLLPSDARALHRLTDRGRLVVEAALAVVTAGTELVRRA